MPSVRMELRRLGGLRKGRRVTILFVRILRGVWLDGEGRECCCWWREGGLGIGVAMTAVKGWVGVFSISIYIREQ